MHKKGTLTKTHRPFVVHRLDKDTSGVMMFALSKEIQEKIMNYWHKMILETNRLLLREMTQDDFSDLAGMLQDPEVMYAYEHDFSARARWPLDGDAPPAIGAGVKA